MKELLEQILTEQKEQTKMLQTIVSSLERKSRKINGGHTAMLLKPPIARKRPKYHL